MFKRKRKGTNLPNEPVSEAVISEAYTVAAIVTGQPIDKIREQVEGLSGFTHRQDVYEILRLMIWAAEPDPSVVAYIRAHGKRPVRVTAGVPPRASDDNRSDDDGGDTGASGVPARPKPDPRPVPLSAGAVMHPEPECVLA